jgi:Arc/MetJ-type ribon-helix-helix transcriptional regulator
MYLTLPLDGRVQTVDMEQLPLPELLLGGHRYHPPRMARQVRRHANRLWGRRLPPAALGARLVFDALDDRPASQRLGDSGSFAPHTGSTVSLGAWPEAETIAIALHEVAHEMHLLDGGYDDADSVVREALALLAEREAGMQRLFEREPYYTASNLVDQLLALPLFAGMPFARRWAEISRLQSAEELADLVNYFLDRDHGLGLKGWLRRFDSDLACRDALLSELAACSLRYSLNYRRALIRALVRCDPQTPLARLVDTLEAVTTLDRRYPDDDLEQIIAFCFKPISRQPSALRALFAGS